MRPGSTRCLFETSIIEPVASRRSSAQQLGAGPHGDPTRGQSFTMRHDRWTRLRLLGQEPHDQSLILGRQDGTGRVQEPPPRGQHAEGGPQDLELGAGEGCSVVCPT